MQFSNGLTFEVFKPTSQSEMACLSLVIKAGSLCDIKPGVAHLLEHLVIADVKHATESSLHFRYNGITDYEYTSYELVLADIEPVIKSGIQILLKCISSNPPSNEHFQMVVRDIQSELDYARKHNPQYHLLPQLFDKGDCFCFPIGTELSVRSFTYSDAIHFLNHHYLPESAMLIYCGSVNTAVIRHYIEELIKKSSMHSKPSSKKVVRPILARRSIHTTLSDMAYTLIIAPVVTLTQYQRATEDLFLHFCNRIASQLCAGIDCSLYRLHRDMKYILFQSSWEIDHRFLFDRLMAMSISEFYIGKQEYVKYLRDMPPPKSTIVIDEFQNNFVYGDSLFSMVEYNKCLSVLSYSDFMTTVKIWVSDIP